MDQVDEQNNTNPPVYIEPAHKISLLYFIGIIAVLIILVGGFLLFKKRKLNTISSQTGMSLQNVSVPTPTLSPIKGTLMLETTNNVMKFSKNQTITIQLTGNSQNEDISGYDALIGYDSEVLTFIKAVSINPDFKLYFFPKKDYVVISAVKSLQKKTPTRLLSTPLASLTFQAKKTGPVSVSLKRDIGKEITQFVNNKTKSFTPQLNILSLEIN